jgi:hypothetical protein
MPLHVDKKYLFCFLILTVFCSNSYYNDFLKGGHKKGFVSADTLYSDQQSSIIELIDTNLSPKEPIIYFVRSARNYKVLFGVDRRNKTYQNICIDSLARLCPRLNDSACANLYMRIFWSLEKNNGINLHMINNDSVYLLTNSALDTIRLSKVNMYWDVDTIRINKKIYD